MTNELCKLCDSKTDTHNKLYIVVKSGKKSICHDCWNLMVSIRGSK